MNTVSQFQFVLPRFFIQVHSSPHIPHITYRFLYFLLGFQGNRFIIDYRSITNLPKKTINPFSGVHA